jgi:4Fe-4S ferredoxin
VGTLIICLVNSLNNLELAAGYLNYMGEKSLIEVKNGKILVLNQDLCGADEACVLICPVNAIKLVKREVK